MSRPTDQNRRPGWPEPWPTPVTDLEIAKAVRRAAAHSVDHILAWFAQGCGSDMAKGMQEEIETNMLFCLNIDVTLPRLPRSYDGTEEKSSPPK